MHGWLTSRTEKKPRFSFINYFDSTTTTTKKPPTTITIMRAHFTRAHFTLFIGNPGVRKSTLLNGLAGGVYFQSKNSLTGVTTLFEIKEIGDNRFLGDTPGLDDISKKKEAADEIHKALMQDGNYKLVFVVTLQRGGRVQNDDLRTMSLVLDALGKEEDRDIPYGIIVNMMDTNSPIFTDDALKEECIALLNLHGNRNKTKHVHFYRHVEALHLKTNVFQKTTPEFKRFVEEEVPSLDILPTQVSTIDLQKYDEMLETIDALKKTFEEQMEANRLQLQETKNQHARLMEATQKQNKKASQKHEQELARQRKNQIAMQALQDKRTAELAREVEHLRRTANSTRRFSFGSSSSSDSSNGTVSSFERDSTFVPEYPSGDRHRTPTINTSHNGDGAPSPLWNTAGQVLGAAVNGFINNRRQQHQTQHDDRSTVSSLESDNGEDVLSRRFILSREFAVGQIWGQDEAAEKVNQWLEENPDIRNDGWVWNGHWQSREGISYAKFEKI